MGLYKTTRRAAWSPAEIKQQRKTFKYSWGMRIRNSVWARPVLARIILRVELGREPTTAEVYSQIKRLGTVQLPQLNDIIAAFEKGEEVRAILSLGVFPLEMLTLLSFRNCTGRNLNASATKTISSWRLPPNGLVSGGRLKIMHQQIHGDLGQPWLEAISQAVVMPHFE